MSTLTGFALPVDFYDRENNMGKDWTPLCNAACIRTGLDHGAALAAIATQKYPNIENP